MRKSNINAEVRAHLSIRHRTADEDDSPAESIAETRATLALRDNISGLVFCEVHLTAHDLADLLAGNETGTVKADPAAHLGHRLIGTPAWIMPPDRRADIGRKHFHVALTIGTTGELGNDEAVSRWADQVAKATGAAQFSTSKRNDGRTHLTLRTYVDTYQEGAVWQADALDIATQLLPTVPKKAAK